MWLMFEHVVLLFYATRSASTKLGYKVLAFSYSMTR